MGSRRKDSGVERRRRVSTYRGRAAGESSLAVADAETTRGQTVRVDVPIARTSRERLFVIVCGGTFARLVGSADRAVTSTQWGRTGSFGSAGQSIFRSNAAVYAVASLALVG